MQRQGAEALDDLVSVAAGRRHPHTRHHRVLVHVESRTSRDHRVHCIAPCPPSGGASSHGVWT